MRAGHEPTLSAAASGAAPRKGCSRSRSAKRDSNKGKPRGQTRQRKQRRKAALLPLSSSLATWAHRCVVCEWYTHIQHSVQVNAQGDQNGFPSIAFCFIALRWVSRWTGSLSFHLPASDMPPCLAFLRGYRGLNLRSLSLYSKCSYPLNWLPNPYTFTSFKKWQTYAFICVSYN